LEATLFANQWKDGIVLVPTTPPLNQYVNTGRNESYGVEFVARRQIDQLRLEGVASFVDSTNKEADTDYVAFPSWILNLEGGYRFVDADLELILKQRIMLDYAEGDYLGAAKPDSADDYYRTDLSLVKGLDFFGMSGDHSAFLQVYNLFDQDNVIPSLYNSEGGLSDRGIGLDVGLSFEW
ncbi:TonB-dependent receptor, partial [Oleiphilus sp. HI0079]|uniref:TonB-dependent receptor domain-containing protein n=3 Tax=Oleiphilus TaxID=141450 RepID=UPI0018D4D433